MASEATMLDLTSRRDALSLCLLFPFSATANGCPKEHKVTTAMQATHLKPQRELNLQTSSFTTDHTRTTMFRRKEDTIAPDASYPANLKELG
jgi:hypothetical protein